MHFILEMQELDFSQSFLFYSADMKYFPLSCCFRNNFAITCHWWIPLELSFSSLLHVTPFLPHSPKHEPSAYTLIKMCFFFNLELPRNGVRNRYNFYATKNNKIIQDQSRGIHFFNLSLVYSVKRIVECKAQWKWKYSTYDVLLLSLVSIIFRVCRS